MSTERAREIVEDWHGLNAPLLVKDVAFALAAKDREIAALREALYGARSYIICPTIDYPPVLAQINAALGITDESCCPHGRPTHQDCYACASPAPDPAEATTLDAMTGLELSDRLDELLKPAEARPTKAKLNWLPPSKPMPYFDQDEPDPTEAMRAALVSARGFFDAEARRHTSFAFAKLVRKHLAEIDAALKGNGEGEAT